LIFGNKMMFNNIAFLALTTASAVEAQTGFMAGLYLRTDVDSYKVKDLVQKQLEDIMGDEECDSFELGRKFYFKLGTGSNPDWLADFPDGGKYLGSIPTYGLGTGESKPAAFNEYTAWAGKNNNFHKQWVNAAFTKKNYESGSMKADFTNGTAFPNDPFGSGQCVGFEESVKKVTSYTYNFIEIAALQEQAIEEAKAGCIAQQTGCQTAMEYWEGAAAIYIGSLEGEEGNEVDDSGSRAYGKSNYALADKRCRNFKTCGPTRDSDASKFYTAPTNTKILSFFAAGTQAAFAGDYALMRDYQKQISSKMAVPYIQGTYRYAWRMSSERSRISGSANSPTTDPRDEDTDLIDPDDAVADDDYSELDKEVGEGAAFAVAAVPKLWACSKKAAGFVWPQLQPGVIAGRAPVNFQLIKTAFECNYKCLNTYCEEIGSLWDGDDEIRNGAKACNDAKLGTSPAGYKKCQKSKAPYKAKCKPYVGKAGIKKRDKPEFFAETLP